MEKMGTSKKFLDWKIGPNNFSRKMEKTGIGSQWKNSGLENRHENF